MATGLVPDGSVAVATVVNTDQVNVMPALAGAMVMTR